MTAMPRSIKTHKGFAWIDNTIIDEMLPIIGYMGLAVYTFFARHANNETGIVTLPRHARRVEQIAKHIGMSVPTLRKALATLVENELMAIHHSYDTSGGCLPNQYQIGRASCRERV